MSAIDELANYSGRILLVYETLAVYCWTYVPPYIYCIVAPICIVYVGLAQARPNYTIYNYTYKHNYTKGAPLLALGGK